MAREKQISMSSEDHLKEIQKLKDQKTYNKRQSKDKENDHQYQDANEIQPSSTHKQRKIKLKIKPYNKENFIQTGKEIHEEDDRKRKSHFQILPPRDSNMDYVNRRAVIDEEKEEESIQTKKPRLKSNLSILDGGNYGKRLEASKQRLRDTYNKANGSKKHTKMLTPYEIPPGGIPSDNNGQGRPAYAFSLKRMTRS